MNKHIVEFLENYIGLSNNPEYAVMLKGEWGCGKGMWNLLTFTCHDILLGNRRYSRYGSA